MGILINKSSSATKINNLNSSIGKNRAEKRKNYETEGYKYRTAILYHVTSSESAKKIVNSGKMYRGASGIFGGGIYFSDTIENAYSTTIYTDAEIVASVVLGFSLICRQNDSSLTYTKLKNTYGCDSVKGIDCVNTPQYVVYNWGQINILKVIINNKIYYEAIEQIDQWKTCYIVNCVSCGKNHTGKCRLKCLNNWCKFYGESHLRKCKSAFKQSNKKLYTKKHYKSSADISSFNHPPDRKNHQSYKEREKDRAEKRKNYEVEGYKYRSVVLYHVTSPEFAKGIVNSGKMDRGTAGMFGGGIYFAETAEIANSKAHSSGAEITAKVVLGFSFICRASDNSLNFITLRNVYGCNSVKGVGCVFRTEYVVYNWGQVNILKVMINNQIYYEPTEQTDQWKRCINANCTYYGTKHTGKCRVNCLNNWCKFYGQNHLGNCKRISRFKQG